MMLSPFICHIFFEDLQPHFHFRSTTCLPYLTRMFTQRFSIILFVFGLISSLASAQEAPVYRKNAISINVTRCATNEISLSYEHRFSVRRAIEFNAGLIYVNDGLQEFAKDWVNTQVFYEHGFAARVYYKIFKKPEDDKTKWRDYISPGISYKYLYYNKQWFENEKTDDKGQVYHERLYQHRFRDKYSLEFLWGKVYEMNQTLAFEFYYGAGLTGTISDRFVIYKQPDDREPEIITVEEYDNSFYVRPSLLVGAKLRISF